MKYRPKLFLSVLASTLVAVSMAYLTLHQAFLKKEGLQIESLALSEANAISQSLELYSQEIKKALLHAHINTDVLNYGPFLALAKLKSNELNYSVKSFFSRSSYIKRRTLIKRLSEIPLANSEVKGRLSFHTIAVSKKRSYLTVFYKSKKTVVVGFLKVNDLSNLLDAKQAENHKIFVLANKRQSIVHPDKKGLGKKLDDHPISKYLLASKHLSGVKTAENDKKDKMVLGYDSIPNTNLVVGIVHTFDKGSILPFLKISELLMAFIIVLVISFFLISFGLSPVDRAFQFLRKSINQLVRDEPLTAPENFSKEVLSFVPLLEALQNRIDTVEKSHHIIEPEDVKAPVQTEAEKYDLFKNYSLNLSQTISKPLGSLLGNLQKAKAETEMDLVTRNINLAQKEARNIRHKLDDLVSAVKEDQPIFNPLLFQDVVSDLIREKVSLFNQKGIKVVKEISSRKYIRSNQVSLEKALSLIIDFFIVNFSSQIQRDLSFSAEDTTNELVFKIYSNSESLTSGLVNDLLEPFCHELTETEDILSLSIANTIIKHLQGAIKVEDGPNQGVGLIIYLPLAAEHEIQNYLEGLKEPEVSVEDPLKDELDEVLAENVDSREEEIVVKHNDSAAQTDDEESFSGFSVDEDELLPQKKETQEEWETSYLKSSPKKSNTEESEEDEFELRKPYDSTEPSIYLADETRDMETEELVEIVDKERAVDNIDNDSDFIIIKTPQASDMPEAEPVVMQPYATEKVEQLADREPVADKKLAFPETPVVEDISLDDIPVNIRKPKVRGDS